KQAGAAIDALNGKVTMEGAPKPLVVKWADADKKALIKSPMGQQMMGGSPMRGGGNSPMRGSPMRGRGSPM
ncbi:hypothetical protein T484DRAFT_1842546, partial [Baffinella frigidus]